MDIEARSAELVIIISYPTRASGIIVLKKKLKRNRFVRTTRRKFNGRYFSGMV